MAVKFGMEQSTFRIGGWSITPNFIHSGERLGERFQKLKICRHFGKRQNLSAPIESHWSGSILTKG